MAISDSGKTIARSLNTSTILLNKSQERLASGKKVNKAFDDAAGLAIAAMLSSDAAVLDVANKNINDGKSSISIADSATSTLNDITTRMSELATQSANGTYSDEQRSQMQAEYDQLSQEAQRIVATTQFNGQKSFSDKSITIQAGTSGDDSSQIEISGLDIKSTTDGFSSNSLSTQADAMNALSNIASAANEITTLRGSFGAVESRLNVASENNSSMKVSELAAESAIMDADIAEESAINVAAKIKAQSGTALMAQSLLSSSLVSKLLG